MRIGILLWELDISGGTQRQAIELARYLIGHGDVVTIYTVYYDRDRCFPKLLEGIEVKSLYTRIIKEKRIKQGTISKIIAGIRELKKCRLLSRMISPEMDVLNVHDDLAFPAAVYWKHRSKGKVVWMINDVSVGLSPIFSESNILKDVKKIFDGRAIGHAIYRRYAYKMDRVFVLDEINEKKYFRLVGIRPKIIRSGLDISNFRFISRNPPENQTLSILSTGIFFPHRRLEDLVDAVRILTRKNVPVLWKHIGSDKLAPEYAKFIYQRVYESGIEKHVEFLGVVSEEELIDEYCSSHIFVFPNAPQTWGLAVFEAMSCGTPVIVSKGSGASEVLSHNLNAILVDPYSPDKIADEILRLYSDSDLYIRLRDNGRIFVENNIRWDIYGQKMRDEFQRI